LRNIDRLILVWLSRLFPSVVDAIVIVSTQPFLFLGICREKLRQSPVSPSTNDLKVRYPSQSCRVALVTAIEPTGASVCIRPPGWSSGQWCVLGMALASRNRSDHHLARIQSDPCLQGQTSLAAQGVGIALELVLQPQPRVQGALRDQQ